MAVVVGNLRHDVSTDVVGLLWVVSYVRNRRCLLDKVRKSITIGIGAVGSAASMPNRLLLRIRRFKTSWRHDACWRCRRRRRNRIKDQEERFSARCGFSH